MPLLGKNNNKLQFPISMRTGFVGFRSYPVPFKTKRTGKSFCLNHSERQRPGWRHTISFHCILSTQNTRNQRRKSLSIQTLHSATYLPTLAILPDEETSQVTLRSTACFLSSISRQHGLTIVSSFLLPTVVPLLL